MATMAHDVVAFEEARAVVRRRRRRIWLPLAVVLVMLLALVGIAIYDYKAMRADALTLSEGVITNLQSRIETEVAAYLTPIPRVIRLSVDVLTDTSLSAIRRDLLEPLALGIVSATPQLASLIVGTPDGEFFMVRRCRDGKQQGLETKTITRPPSATDEPQMRLRRRGPAGKVISDESVPWDGYDPRKRPWYRGAADISDMYWTDVYPFFTDRAPGITGAQAYRDATGKLVAVVGADVKLESLSHFLARLKIGKTGFALIVDDEGRVIAHPTAALARQDAEGDVRLTRVSDLKDPVVSRAFDRYRVEGHGRRDFELDGRRYISSALSLNHLLQRDWSILVVVPEDDFVGFVVKNVGKTLGMGLSVIGLAAILAGLLIRQGLRTDRDALHVLEREAQLDAQSEAFGRLAMQSSLFDASETQALAPVSEAVARASRVRRASLWRLTKGGEGLTCVDCFDQETEGHTQGTVLQHTLHAGLFELLGTGVSIREIDASRNEQLRTLYHGYLAPIGCRALLSVPVLAQGQIAGALWLEDRRRRGDWSESLERFARAVANLLAMRLAGVDAPSQLSPEAGATVENGSGVGPRPHQQTAPRTHPGDIDPGLGVRRAAAFTAHLTTRAEQAEVTRVDVIDQLAVLALRFTDAAALAEPFGDGTDESAIAYLIRELETAATTYGLAYLKFLTDQVVAAVAPQEDKDQAATQLIDFALAIQDTCERLFATWHAPLAFRIGIDLGPVIGSIVGQQRPTFNLWGEAVQMAGTMADTGLPGAIHVTESVYQTLNDRYLFQLRGRHYLEGVGEFSTYLLSGRL